MGNLTVTLKDEKERKLRRLAKEKYGGKKGSIAKTLEEGIDKLDTDSKRERARQQLIQLMEIGFDMGKNLIRHRNELYDRK